MGTKLDDAYDPVSKPVYSLDGVWKYYLGHRSELDETEAYITTSHGAAFNIAVMQYRAHVVNAGDYWSDVDTTWRTTFR